MTQLGLLLWLLTAPLADSATLVQLEAAPLPSVADPCAAAKRIVAQGACLRPEDCGALRSWKRLFGAPRVEPLDPRLAVRDVSVVELPTSYLCLASVEGRARWPAAPR